MDEAVKVFWVDQCGKRCLKFRFEGELYLDDAMQAIEEWRNAFSSKEGEKIPLIWDCREMSGYQTKARELWTVAMMDLKPQIYGIWLITESSMVKMGATVMAMASSIEVKIVGSEDEIIIV